LSSFTPEQMQILLYGTGKEQLKVRFSRHGGEGSGRLFTTKFEGIINNLQRRHRDTQSDYSRSEIEKYMASIPCSECEGKRLRPEALGVLISGKPIVDITHLSITEALAWFDTLAGDATPLSTRDQTIARQILKEIRSRLEFLVDVGLNY